jgi:hypothetical protein
MASKAATEKRDVKRRLLETSCALKNQHIEPSARALLCCDIRTHLEQPTCWVIQNWLTMNENSYFRASGKKVTTLAIQGVTFREPCVCRTRSTKSTVLVLVVSHRIICRVFRKPRQVDNTLNWCFLAFFLTSSSTSIKQICVVGEHKRHCSSGSSIIKRQTATT